jgi:hypothetical protein
LQAGYKGKRVFEKNGDSFSHHYKPQTTARFIHSFRVVVTTLVVKITGNRTFKTSSKLYQDLVAKVISTKENTYLVGADFAVN